ncbi:MAG: 2OG-Fe(II) oxygenase [Pseudomonadota bacterium]|nr:2OG-Fe(II) oxygenase [Pseudomonadota bacterium]
MEKKIPDEWKEWIGDNLKKGSDPDEVLFTMTEAGFDKTVAEDLIKATDVNQDALEVDRLKYKEFENKRILTAYFKRGLHKLGLYNTGSLKLSKGDKFDSSVIELYTIPDLLADQECDQVTDLIKTKLRPSKIIHEGEYDDSIRTSSTCDLGHLESPLIASIDECICSLLGLGSEYSEITQGQLYEVGQEFKGHHDYFDGTEVLVEKHTRYQGQRTYTVMVYLNNVDEGGETYFPHLNLTFKPVKGMALVWNNLNFDGMPNEKTLHQGKPVISGYKSIITKWFREKKRRT